MKRVPLDMLDGGDSGASDAPEAREAPNALPISETFTSLQGEGKLSGVPSWFVRTSGCNLRCAWCDTPYASWKPEGVRRTLDSLIEEARDILAKRIRHVVLTGGEPMLFAALAPLSAALRAMGMHITIETAGTIDPNRDPNRAPTPDCDVACDLLSLSPKLSTSTPREGDERDPGGTWRRRHEQRRISIDALTSLLARYPERQLKFVACEERDLTEIEELLATLTARGSTIDPSDVLLMPEGVKSPSPHHRAWVNAACLARGWRYCARLHIELYGNTRGT